MGVETDKAKEKWQQLYEQIASGEISAGEAIDTINESIATEAAEAQTLANKNGTVIPKEATTGLTVTSAMQAESASFVGPTVAGANYAG
jgi:Asp-tRNA(Asn)/Glu-tRNA(Gln) amidotransferase B subunit